MIKFGSQPFGINLLIILIRNVMWINDHIKILATSFKVLDRLS